MDKHSILLRANRKLAGELTELLQAVDEGDLRATERLLSTVYDELRRIASRKLANETPGQTLQTTALVHEAYLKLLPTNESEPADSIVDPDELPDVQQLSWQSRKHFFAAAAQAMRRILIDHARKKKRQKRGGDRIRVEYDERLAIVDDDVDILALDEALSALEEHSREKATIVQLRYFAGLSLEETAAALDTSVPTVHRHWRYARAWLRRKLEDG